MRLHFIDGLRGIAASAVMLFHFNERVREPWWGEPFRYGYLGVAIFFVLSGFVICMSVGDRRVGAGFLGRFALRRSVRLDILYWVSIAATIAVGVLGRDYGVNQEPISVPQVAAHLFYLQNILGYDALSPIYWTLCYEIQFYLTLVVLIWIMQRLFNGPTRDIVRKPGFQWGFLSLFVLSVLQRTSWHGLPDSLFVNFWFCFALGVMTFWVTQGWLSTRYWYAIMVPTLLWGVIHRDAWFIVGCVTAGLIFLAARLDRFDWLSNPVMQFLGRISYSLYITHILFGWYAVSIAMKFVNAPLAMLAGVVASLISAWLAYILIEMPSVALSRKVAMESRSAAGLPAAIADPAQSQ